MHYKLDLLLEVSAPNINVCVDMYVKDAQNTSKAPKAFKQKKR